MERNITQPSAQRAAGPQRPLTMEDAAAKEEYAYSVALQAYLFTLPLTMTERERKRRIGLQEANPNEPLAPINQLGHMRKLSTAKGDLPYSPNHDTAYTGMLMELRDEPMILRVPEIRDRFFTVQVSDAYTNNLPYVVGTRHSGGRGGDLAFVGPNWQGTLPPNVTEVSAPTDSLIFTIRIRIDGAEDLAEVNRLQDLFSVSGLSQWRAGPANGAPTAPNPLPRPNYQGDFAYFRTVADLMKENPPGKQHAAMVESFENIGLVVGAAFDPRGLDEPTRKGVLRAEKVGPSVLKWRIKHRGVESPSYWGVDLQGGSFGFDYLSRAEVALSGLVVNDPDVALYFLTYFDGQGNALEGGKRYRVHFGKEQIPACAEGGFWSLTLYDGKRFQFVDNPIDRYSIGSRTRGLQFNPDGSLDIYIQPEAPAAAKAANWLPAPKSGPIRLNIRCYLPKPEMLSLDSVMGHLPPVLPAREPD